MSGVLSLLVGGRTVPALSASLTPTTSAWAFVDAEFGPDYWVADVVAATPSGGVAPYNYSWQVVSGSAVMGPFSVTVPTSFTGEATVIRCAVTDAAGQTAYTENCTIG